MGPKNVGGLIGAFQNSTNSGIVTYSFWTSEKAGVAWSAAGDRRTLEEMKKKENYSGGFDFTSETVWKMGEEYPELIFNPKLEIN